jgi:hypothetical protein
MNPGSFTPAISGFKSSTDSLHGGYGPRAIRSLFREAAAQALASLKADYFGGVEAYRLDERLAEWARTADRQACARRAGQIFATLDYYHSRLVLPGRIERLPSLCRRYFESYFWMRALENLGANLEPLLKALAVTALLPDEWYPQAVLDRQIRDALGRLKIFKEIEITPELGLPPGGLGWMAGTTREAVESLRENLPAGRPCPLHLLEDPVRVCGNRQVIAYDLEETGKRLRLEIYEPDCVCTEHALLVDLRGERPVVVEHCLPGPDRPVAGLICSGYKPVEPPAGALSRFQRSPRIRGFSWALLHWAQRMGSRLLPT